MTTTLDSLRALLRHARALDKPVIEAAIAEIEALRCDVERHVAICADLATEAERRE